MSEAEVALAAPWVASAIVAYDTPAAVAAASGD